MGLQWAGDHIKKTDVLISFILDTSSAVKLLVLDPNFDLNNDAEDIDLAPEEEIGAEIDEVIEDPKPAFLTPNPTGDLFSVTLVQ